MYPYLGGGCRIGVIPVGDSTCIVLVGSCINPVGSLFDTIPSPNKCRATSTATTSSVPCHHVVKALVVEAAEEQALRGLDDGDRDVADRDEDHHLVHSRDARQQESEDGRDACFSVWRKKVGSPERVRRMGQAPPCRKSTSPPQVLFTITQGPCRLPTHHPSSRCSRVRCRAPRPAAACRPPS